MYLLAPSLLEHTFDGGGVVYEHTFPWPRTAVPKRVFACERMFHPPRVKPLWHKGFSFLPAVRPCFACVIMRTPVRCMGYRCSVLPEQLFVAGLPGYEHMCGLGELIMAVPMPMACMGAYGLSRSGA